MPTVLVVDDEWDIRELLVDTMIDAGLDVIEAGDGKSALDRAERDQPDVILLDIWMPGMDGFEVLHNLKKDPKTEWIPVVMLTAMPATEGEHLGLREGVSHYITKPWEPGIIEATVRVALREAGVKVSQFEEENDADGFSVGAGNVELKASDTRIFNMQGAMARLRTGKKKQTVTNEEGEEIQVIQTGGKLVALEQRMGGGLPLGSVTLAVGAASSGKSVLCQHLAYGALQGDYGVAYFSSEHSPDSLLTQMRSLGLDASQYARKSRLHIYPMPEPEDGEQAGPVLNQVSDSIESLSRGAQFIVIDSITDLAGAAPEQGVIAFFTTCRRLGNQGRTIFVSVHTYAFGSEMLTRLRTLCDGYLTLGSEQVRGKSVRTLEVNKINTTELSNNNAVSFVVEPEVGMRVIPLNKSKA
ncbi:MAG: response regulator [Dehalococcoidia bacterium]